MATLEDCWRPDLTPHADALEAEHAAQAALLAVQDRPVQRRRPAVADDARVDHDATAVAPHRLRDRALEERADLLEHLARARAEKTAAQFEQLFERIYQLSKRAPFVIKVTEGQHLRRYVAQRSETEPEAAKWTTDEKFVIADRFFLGEKDAETMTLAAAIAARASVSSFCNTATGVPLGASSPEPPPNS